MKTINLCNLISATLENYTYTNKYNNTPQVAQLLSSNTIYSNSDGTEQQSAAIQISSDDELFSQDIYETFYEDIIPTIESKLLDAIEYDPTLLNDINKDLDEIAEQASTFAPKVYCSNHYSLVIIHTDCTVFYTLTFAQL